ncbi:MAG: NDP-sugar synthase [Holophagales bacterium]|nr:NDP-sugar synthase [Holophagales bacterium]MYG30998.1 NDP-sugar synthase [Holophagales bacterium]MYI80264.1 NDP-sugar synthase [Holophagales bacterium]
MPPLRHRSGAGRSAGLSRDLPRSPGAARGTAPGHGVYGVRALVLCAGRGERLRPLTGAVPKPLLPVAGRAVAMRTIDLLHRAGCEIAVNLCHLGDAVRRGLESEAVGRGLELRFEVEPDLLGTLGAVVNLRDFLADADEVVLVNGDSLCRWPIRQALDRHRRSGADVTLQVGWDDRVGGGVEVDPRGLVVGLRDLQVGTVRGRKRTFQGLHVLSRRVVEQISTRPSSNDIVEGLYQPLLRAGARIAGFRSRRPWHDLGTPRRYLEGALDWGRTAGGRRRRRRFIAPGVSVAPGAVVEHSVLEPGSHVGEGAVVERSLVMPGARIGPGARIRETILAPGVGVSEFVRIDEQLVTPVDWGLGAGSRERDGLVFTPL